MFSLTVDYDANLGHDGSERKIGDYLDEDQTYWTQPVIQFATTTPPIIHLQDEPEPDEAEAQFGICLRLNYWLKLLQKLMI